MHHGALEDLTQKSGAQDFLKSLGIRAMTFNESSLITCYANDYGYENWVKEAIKSYSKKTDLVILISSSGESQNILNAAKYTVDQNLKLVEAVFYFKDNTTLFVWADKGIYNTRTLDMDFLENVKAKYEGSELFAEKAEYSNSKGYLVISEKVKVKDLKGTMVADELLFDIKNQTLDIASFNDSKINANVNLK